MLNVLDLRNKEIKAIDEEMELMMALNRAMEDVKNGKVEVVKNDEDLNNYLKELEKIMKDINE